MSSYVDGLPERPDRLLFPGSRSGQHMRPSSLYTTWYRARDAVGFPTLRWHDLRHFPGATAAQTGATLVELAARLGHSTVQAAMTYEHAVSGRDDEIAAAMSNVLVLKPRTSPQPPGADPLSPVWVQADGGVWHRAWASGRGYCGRRVRGNVVEHRGARPRHRCCVEVYPLLEKSRLW